MKNWMKTLTVAAALTILAPLASQAIFIIDDFEVSSINGVNAYALGGGASDSDTEAVAGPVGGERFVQATNKAAGGTLNVNMDSGDSGDLVIGGENNAITYVSLTWDGIQPATMNVDLTDGTGNDQFGIEWLSADSSIDAFFTVLDADGTTGTWSGLTLNSIGSSTWQYIPFASFSAAGGDSVIDWTQITSVQYELDEDNLTNTDHSLEQIVTLNLIPEPTTAGLLLFGLVGLLRRRRR